jgi:hypothetical protein
MSYTNGGERPSQYDRHLAGLDGDNDESLSFRHTLNVPSND